MDETFSVLDPIAESEINNTVIEKVKNRSLIIISHRISTVQNVDEIYLIEQGKIKERGNHSALIALGGNYANMNNVQAEKYREKINNKE